jgi:hypothetical protein
MNKQEISFELKCSCGETLKGFFSSTDKKENLYCSCKLVWPIVRPQKEK